jgi:hypothetical protein
MLQSIIIKLPRLIIQRKSMIHRKDRVVILSEQEQEIVLKYLKAYPLRQMGNSQLNMMDRIASMKVMMNYHNS